MHRQHRQHRTAGRAAGGRMADCWHSRALPQRDSPGTVQQPDSTAGQSHNRPSWRSTAAGRPAPVLAWKSGARLMDTSDRMASNRRSTDSCTVKVASGGEEALKGRSLKEKQIPSRLRAVAGSANV